ncbi:unnamed protein product [Clonostachys rosea]|uniref:Heterokaryon incompatibility domain-containing protein n=1 Tax=Bionectria ochroleuca TaxID=29856 RepID=A0ABY6TNG5_BIOOC|nr:unnamed protein product [Clonostachys rosea]
MWVKYAVSTPLKAAHNVPGARLHSLPVLVGLYTGLLLGLPTNFEESYLQYLWTKTMNYDEGQSFGDSFASPRELKSQLLTITNLIKSKYADGEAPKPLFLALPKTTPELARQHESDILHAFTTKDAQDPDLVLSLVEKQELKFKFSTHLAVSYTWQQSSDTEYLPVRIREVDGTIRPSRAPSKILRRAILHAELQDVYYIWIDQECIDQNDQAAKERAVQHMDALYTNDHVAFLLDTNIDDKFIPIVTEWFNVDEVSLQEARQLASKLSELFETLGPDPWFERAWVTQERLCSSLSGGNTNLMLRRKSLDPGKLPEEIPCSPSNLRHLYTDLVEKLGGDGVHEDSAKLKAAMEEFQDRYRLPSDMPTLRYIASPYRSACNCLNAYGMLKGQKCSQVADKVALVGNSCFWRNILDTREIIKQGLSYNACVWALALANGHASFLCQDPACKSSYKEDRMLWVPTKSTTVSKLRCSDFINGAQMELTEAGLVTDGWLFRISRFIELGPLKERFIESDKIFHEETDGSKEKKGFSKWYRDFFQDLLISLVKQREFAVAELVWKAVKKRVRGGFYGRSVYTIPDIPLSKILDPETGLWIASYETFGFESKSAWETDPNLEEIWYRCDPTSAECWNDILGGYKQLSGLRWISEAVMRDGGLVASFYETPSGVCEEQDHHIAISHATKEGRSHVFAQNREVRICKGGDRSDKLVFNPHPFDVWLRERDSHVDAPFTWACEERLDLNTSKASSETIVEGREENKVLFDIGKIESRDYTLAWPREYDQDDWNPLA